MGIIVSSGHHNCNNNRQHNHAINDQGMETCTFGHPYRTQEIKPPVRRCRCTDEKRCDWHRWCGEAINAVINTVIALFTFGLAIGPLIVGVTLFPNASAYWLIPIVLWLLSVIGFAITSAVRVNIFDDYFGEWLFGAPRRLRAMYRRSHVVSDMPPGEG